MNTVWITKNDLEKARSCDIRKVVEQLGIPMKNNMVRCPFHADKKPSMGIDRRRNLFFCYACGAKGDVIGLVMKVRKVSFVEACLWLLDNLAGHQPEVWIRDSPLPTEAPIPDLDYLNKLMYRPVLNPEAQHFLFDERKISREVASQLGLSSISFDCPMSSSPRSGNFNGPALLIPYRDLEGKLMSVQSRYLGTEPGKPRFRFPAGSNCRIFNMPVLKKLLPGEPLFIAEGGSDCLALLSAGCQAIAIPSATLLKKEDSNLLQGLNVHMFPDADEAGERLFRELKELCPQLVRHSLPPGVKDVGEHWKNIKSINHNH